MTKRLLSLSVGVCVAAAVLAAAPAPRHAAAFLDGAPPGFTGGFGERTCAQCHFDVARPDPAGAVEITGLPEGGYTPGTRYLLTVALRRGGMERGGFQMAARFEAGDAKGRQAGGLAAADARAQVLRFQGVQYAQHTADGAAPTAPGEVRWRIEWTAPARAAGPVVFHLVGNAADGDDSQMGDHVYTTQARRPAASRSARPR